MINDLIKILFMSIDEYIPFVKSKNPYINTYKKVFLINNIIKEEIIIKNIDIP